MTLDIVLGIGCPIQCRYCPQEVIVKKHRMPPLTLEAFKRYARTIPDDELLIFAGISEPFIFPDTVEMILYAHEKGHPINLFTTLVGLKPGDARRLMKIPFNKVVLHLPDAEGNAKIPATQDYYESLYTFFTSVHNLQCMNMGRNFISDHNEDVLRGNAKTRKKGRVMCPNLGSRAYMLFPDGMVTLCCMLRGMEGIIGNLNEDTYPELMAKFGEIATKYQKDESTMCHLCSVAENYWWYHLKKPISAIIRNPAAIRVRNKYKVFPVVENQFVNQLNTSEGL
jgi:sulfatase maturation enzyme AslB (radical SAM superfamily)